jgi:hypothetical protein
MFESVGIESIPMSSSGHVLALASCKVGKRRLFIANTHLETSSQETRNGEQFIEPAHVTYLFLRAI